jgi:hypothetical protein
MGNFSNRNDRIFHSLLFARWIIERDSVHKSISQFCPGVDANRKANLGIMGKYEFAS